MISLDLNLISCAYQRAMVSLLFTCVYCTWCYTPLLRLIFDFKLLQNIIIANAYRTENIGNKDPLVLNAKIFA